MRSRHESAKPLALAPSPSGHETRWRGFSREQTIMRIDLQYGCRRPARHGAAEPKTSKGNQGKLLTTYNDVPQVRMCTVSEQTLLEKHSLNPLSVYVNWDFFFLSVMTGGSLATVTNQRTNFLQLLNHIHAFFGIHHTWWMIWLGWKLRKVSHCGLFRGVYTMPFMYQPPLSWLRQWISILLVLITLVNKEGSTNDEACLLSPSLGTSAQCAKAV